MSIKRQVTVNVRSSRKGGKFASVKQGKFIVRHFSSSGRYMASTASAITSRKVDSRAFREYASKITKTSNYLYQSESDEIDRMIAVTENLDK